MYQQLQFPTWQFITTLLTSFQSSLRSLLCISIYWFMTSFNSVQSRFFSFHILFLLLFILFFRCRVVKQIEALIPSKKQPQLDVLGAKASHILQSEAAYRPHRDFFIRSYADNEDLSSYPISCWVQRFYIYLGHNLYSEYSIEHTFQEVFCKST